MKTAAETSAKPPATAESGLPHDFSSTEAPAGPRLPQTASIATGGSPKTIGIPESFRPVLPIDGCALSGLRSHPFTPIDGCALSGLRSHPFTSRELSKSLLGFLDVFQGEIARFDQTRHDRFRTAAEQTQQFVDEPVLRGVTRNRRLENVRVADPLCAPEGALAFHTVDRCLYGRVRRPVLLRECFVNLSNGACAPSPERLHHLKLQLGELG